MSAVVRRTQCRGCGSADLELVFRLRPSPVGDDYVTQSRRDEPQPAYPIDLHMCGDCGLAQLVHIVDAQTLYGEYIYVTASSLGLADHFRAYADSVIQRCKLPRDSLAVDIGSNDGTLLGCFQQRGHRVLGVEPAAHIASAAGARGIPTIPEFFTPALAQRIRQEHGPAKLITANNVFANIDDLDPWLTALDTLLADDGMFVFESYYLGDLVKNMVFDFIYHEHLSSFSVRPVQALFERAGFEVAAAERVATKGGSLRYFVQRVGGPLKRDGSIEELRAAEDRMRLYDPATFAEFAEKVDALKQQTLQCLRRLKAEGKTIAGFGASITGTTLIYHFELGEYLDYLIDDNPAKQGRFSPGLHLPVLACNALYEREPDYVLVLAWRYADPFIAKHADYLSRGGSFIVPVPEFRIVTQA